MTVPKRYQVFVSSTFRDLQEERLEVLKALLELDCIPSGMEYFPAANEEVWAYIEDLIGACDYYIVILAGKYGSVGPDGIGYTQKEYEYAVAQGIPVIAFLHSDKTALPASKNESDPVLSNRLREFEALAKQRLCKHWTTTHELGAVVSRSLTQLIKKHPRPGWVPATSLASDEATQEILALRRRVEAQEEEIARLKNSAPESAKGLAEDNDKYSIAYTMTLVDAQGTYTDRLDSIKVECQDSVTWNEILAAVGPHLLDDAKESVLKTGLGRLLRERMHQQLEDLRSSSEKRRKALTRYKPSSALVSDQSLQQIKVHLAALGVITLWNVAEDGKRVPMCKLTDLGRKRLVDVVAVKKTSTPKAEV